MSSGSPFWIISPGGFESLGILGPSRCGIDESGLVKANEGLTVRNANLTGNIAKLNYMRAWIINFDVVLQYIPRLLLLMTVMILLPHKIRANNTPKDDKSLSNHPTARLEYHYDM